jgi:hypothetical protein
MRRKDSLLKQADLRDMFKEASKVTVYEPLLLHPIPYCTNFFTQNDSRKHR